jgi:hypothetical protein
MGVRKHNRDFYFSLAYNFPAHRISNKNGGNGKSKQINQDSSGGKYLIFTDNEVLENTDSLWYWKWNSSDFYNKIEAGKTYKFTVYGWRVPFMSWYRNIVEVEQTN